MAHYHASVKSGAKGTGAGHAQYIERGGRFSVEKFGEIGDSERGNLPEWAGGSAARFFAAADEHERANGSAYREFELALPRELNDGERLQLVRGFVAQEIGERHAYVWAIHEPKGANPHVHIMFSERTRDGIERGPEQYFKRANSKAPERGGCAKSQAFSGGMTAAQRDAALEAFRGRWTLAQNLSLERAGHEVRVDHRSLAAQGIEREAGQHRGPAISGIEARGQEAEVSARRAAERTMRAEAVLRQPEHQERVAELRKVTRAEVAAERSAARERRELLPETDGMLRKDLEHQVESDRREQIARVEAQVERRIERRAGLTGRWGERLLEQARALRDRMLELGGRVKEWVQGLWQRRDHGLERQVDREGPRERTTLDLAAVKARGRAASDRWREQLHERQAQAKQQALELRARERVVQSFQELAHSREVRWSGYGDRSEQWRATPAALREQIDRYNALPTQARAAALEQLVREPAKVRTLERWIGERQQRVRELGLDRGLESLTMDDEAQELKIAALIDAADAAQARALETIEALNATRAGLQQAVAQAARASTQEALKSLHGELERAQHVVIDLQRLSLWRAAWQHVMVALVAIVVTLVAVWWYVPSVNDMQALRAEKVQLEASIADLEQRGGKLQISHCGPEKRVCVAVDDYAGIYGKDADYRIAKGY